MGICDEQYFIDPASRMDVEHWCLWWINVYFLLSQYHYSE